MLNENDLSKLQAINSINFLKSSIAIDRAFNDITLRKGYFMNFAKMKFQILADMTDDYLFTVGTAIVNNLGIIKSYDFITIFLNSLYEIYEITYSENYLEAGSLEVLLKVSNIQSIFKVYNNGLFKVYSFGDFKVYQRQAIFNDLDLNSYLYYFLIFGVYLKNITISDEEGRAQLFSNQEALASNDINLYTLRG